MGRLIVLALALALAGCFADRISAPAIDAARMACAPAGGLAWVEKRSENRAGRIGIVAGCRNGYSIRLTVPKPEGVELQ